MLQEKLVGILTSFLAKIRENGDIAADDGLQGRAEVSDHAARTDDDAAHDSEIANDAITGEFVCGRHHTEVHTVGHIFLLKGTFTGAILPAQADKRERSLSAILERHGKPGNLILFFGNTADPSRPLFGRIRNAVAGLCAAAHAHGSWFLFDEGSGVVSMQR